MIIQRVLTGATRQVILMSLQAQLLLAMERVLRPAETMVIIQQAATILLLPYQLAEARL